QSEVFYPLRVLLNAAFERETALNVYLFLHMWASGCFFYLFARLWFARFPALLCGLCWMLGGCLPLRGVLDLGVPFGPFLPALMWATERLVRRRGPRRAAEAAFFAALLLVAGHKQFTIYSFFYAFFYFVYRGFNRWGFLALFLAFLLTTPGWVTYLELGRLS